MGSPDHWRKLERMYASAPVSAVFGAELEVGDGEAQVRLQSKPEFFHAAHAAHGCVYFKALDDAAFFAANSMVDNALVLTISFTIYFTRPLRAGMVTATGKLVHRSGQLFIAESVGVDESGHEVARGSGMFLASRIMLSPAIGYA